MTIDDLTKKAEEAKRVYDEVEGEIKQIEEALIQLLPTGDPASYNAAIIKMSRELVPLRIRARQADAGLLEALNILDIALDHGLEAAMTFKLSGGNIDPRKGGYV